MAIDKSCTHNKEQFALRSMKIIQIFSILQGLKLSLQFISVIYLETFPPWMLDVKNFLIFKTSFSLFLV